MQHIVLHEIPNKRELQEIASNHSSYIDFKDFMKLYKDYTNGPYSFLLNGTTLSSGKSIAIYEELIMKMSISEKIKEINNKIEQNKAQYDLDRQITKISALSSWNVSKYEFLTVKEVLPVKDLLEKVATMNICPKGKN